MNIKQWFRLRKARERFNLLAKMIDAIDKGFAKSDISRQRRRQFWDDFISSPESRKKILEDMARGFK